MDPLSEKQIREAIRNCSRGERQKLNVPRLQEVDWSRLEYLGWRDPRAPQRAYLVLDSPQGPRGITARAPDTVVRRTAQCFLCHSIHQGGVSLFAAPRGGAGGRNGNTVGTYICADLACSAHLRAALRPSRTLPDPEPVIAARGQDLIRRLDGFISSVIDG